MKTVLAGVVGSLLCAAILATDSPDGVWQDAGEKLAGISSADRVIVPKEYRLLSADIARLGELLNRAPMEGSVAAKTSPLVMTLPLPDGLFSRFRIEEAPILEPELAAKFPEIRTYRGQGIDDPSATAALDWTAAGFHGMILSERGTIYIDPYRREDIRHYISYFKRDLERDPADRFHCDFEASLAKDSPRHRQLTAMPQESLRKQASGSTLRTYRLAVVANVEYTAFHGGTGTAAVAAMTTTVNRVDGIYERELAVRLVFVYARVYTAEDDGYDNNVASQMSDRNQIVLDFYLGSANYDIGHVFSTGGGGRAELGSVCISGRKARGVTGSSSPAGDSFDVDYVAHDMGHQFGANHTFNGTTGNCGGARNAGTAYEPGSGSSIMAYARLCGSENLQLYSDDYFHGASFDEIVAYTTTGFGSACPGLTATGNGEPTVAVPAAVMIPRDTPFVLSGSATDPNGDPLTYSWEQFDLGAASPPNTDNGLRPIFRSFLPSGSPSRTFPKLSDILTNSSTLGELLPTTTRVLTFSLTARDNRAGGGGVSFANTVVNVTSTAGPFLVTAPNTAVNWQIGSTQTATWSVANTNASPVNCSAVNILLSRDGGNAFPAMLVSATPNDGSQSVLVPGPATSQARLKVECAGNIFFDISDTNFAIFATPAPVVSSINPISGPTAGGTPFTISGTGFQAGATVTLGGAAATGVNIVNPTTITATTAPHAPGPVNVVVTNGDTQTGFLPNGYTYADTAGPLRFFTVDPCRVADTRDPADAYGGPALAASMERVFTIAGRCGVPLTARAVSFNVTVTGPTMQGHLSLYPGGTALPLVSAINFRPGLTRANDAVVLMGPGGSLAVFCGAASGTVELILDVNGYFQ